MLQNCFIRIKMQENPVVTVMWYSVDFSNLCPSSLSYFAMEELLVHCNIHKTFPSLLFLVSVPLHWPNVVHLVIHMTEYLKKQTHPSS